MNRNKPKPIGRFVSIAGYSKQEIADAAYGAHDGRMIQHPNLEDPRWHQVGDAIYQRKNGSFFLHHLLTDNDAEPVGNITVEITRRQALSWWIRHFGPEEEDYDALEHFRSNVPKELRRGLWD